RLLHSDAGIFSLNVGLDVEGAYVASVSFADAGLGPVVRHFSLDFTPPTFSIVAEAAPVRRSTSSITEVDPSSDGGRWLYRRDETVRLRVTSDHAAVDPS